MPAVHISDRAMDDIVGIWAYIAADNPAAADQLLERISDRCQSYAHQPEIGERRVELGHDIRCFSVGLYVIYYRPATDGVEVVRVLHGARDVAWH
ncbi:MAG: type II toxin-antitoxin system RelE/ParE family toxin [Planctomycetaceae bacterium]